MTRLAFTSALLLAVVVGLLAVSIVEARPPPGDVDQNAFVNAIDAALVLQYSAGLLPSIAEEGNVNFDEQTNSVDAA